MIYRSTDLLMPAFARRVLLALGAAKAAGYPVEIFESWRSPIRQNELFAQGRTKPGKIVTQARAGDSWHQYGLAVDLAIMVNGRWSWDFDFAKVRPYFDAQGLENLQPFEQAHFQLTGGVPIAVARRLTILEGLPAVWLEVQKWLKPA